ncbi:MAG: hypothetical protein LBR22_06580 [Desulfovibrio sp.]|jgi:hypothetical protein|nr:hypothetical protein [Desulfovibrio sp.]
MTTIFLSMRANHGFHRGRHHYIQPIAGLRGKGQAMQAVDVRMGGKPHENVRPRSVASLVSLLNVMASDFHVAHRAYRIKCYMEEQKKDKFS